MSNATSSTDKRGFHGCAQVLVGGLYSSQGETSMNAIGRSQYTRKKTKKLVTMIWDATSSPPTVFDCPANYFYEIIWFNSWSFRLWQNNIKYVKCPFIYKTFPISHQCSCTAVYFPPELSVLFRCHWYSLLFSWCGGKMIIITAHECHVVYLHEFWYYPWDNLVIAAATLTAMRRMQGSDQWAQSSMDGVKIYGWYPM